MNIDISIFFTKYGAFKANNAIQKILDKNLDIKEFLENLYSDSLSIQETIYRYKNNINERPVCKFCGKPAIFITYKGFLDYCDNENCRYKHIDMMSKNTKLKKYGDPNYNNREKSSVTKMEKYGDPTYNNRDKCKQTIFEHWGVNNYNNSEKSKQTKIEKYGYYFVNPEKAKQTKKERYDDENYNNYEKIKESYKAKTGYDTPLENPEAREKGYKARIEKYGYYFVNPEKAKQTKKERYDDENYNNRPLAEITTMNRYGSKNYFSSKEGIEKSHTKEALEKINITKRKNNTFHTSNIEDQIFNELKDIFDENDIIRQYKSQEYPFNCDFYIKSLNMYIECNFHWTHGGHLFDINDINDVNILSNWKQKNTKFYNNAIKTWTYRDVQKYNIAKNNKLNYISLYNIQQYNEFINNFK